MTATSESRTYERTKYEALLDVQHGCVAHRLNERVHNRLDSLLGFVGLAGGSSAVAAGLTQNVTAAAWIGAALALLAISERMLSASRKAEIHRQGHMAFAELYGRADGMTLQALDAELFRLRATLPDGFDGLGAVAFNRNMQTNGRTDYLMKLSPWSKLLEFLV